MERALPLRSDFSRHTINDQSATAWLGNAVNPLLNQWTVVGTIAINVLMVCVGERGWGGRRKSNYTVLVWVVQLKYTDTYPSLSLILALALTLVLDSRASVSI